MERKIPQLAGTMYQIFYQECLPRLHKQTFRDEAHVRHEMEMEAAAGLVGWNIPTDDHNVNAIVEYAVACWEVICANREASDVSA